LEIPFENYNHPGSARHWESATIVRTIIYSQKHLENENSYFSLISIHSFRFAERERQKKRSYTIYSILKSNQRSDAFEI
jgi:hypothetical protein